MKMVYFVRHGLTLGNNLKQFQHPDTELSPEGIEQAAFVAERFKTIPIDVILTSDMTRARQTAEKIAEATGKAVVTTELLREVKRPTSVLGQSRLDPKYQAVQDELTAHFGDTEWRYEDEENYFEMTVRAKEALELILGRKEEQILVVTHGFVSKMLIACAILSDVLTPDIFRKIDAGFATFNTGITKLKFDERGWYLLTWNDHAHFGETKELPKGEPASNARY